MAGIFGRVRQRRTMATSVWMQSLGTLTRQNWWDLKYQAPITLKGYSLRGQNSICWDNIHPSWSPHRRRAFQQTLADAWQDNGGDFSSIQVTEDSFPKGVGTYERVPSNLNDGMRYVGGFSPAFPNLGYGSLTDYNLQNVGSGGLFVQSYADASALGPTAWRRFAPKLSSADMGQFVGEIRETLPMLKSTAKSYVDAYSAIRGRSRGFKMSKDLSNYWLNLQFGWRPFLNDVIRLGFAVGETEARLQQCIRDNGRNIRRGGVLRSIVGPEHVVGQSTTQNTSWCYPVSELLGLVTVPPGNAMGSQTTMTYGYTIDTWYSACYRYWLPYFAAPNEPMNVLDNYLRMYGIRITPLLIWNLTPWSWLADWVGNVGDNLANYTSQAAENMTAKYAYIMEQRTMKYTNHTWIKIGGPNVTTPCELHLEWARTASVKTRRHASAFGFSITPPDFSAKQWSILAALGVSRLKMGF